MNSGNHVYLATAKRYILDRGTLRSYGVHQFVCEQCETDHDLCQIHMIANMAQMYRSTTEVFSHESVGQQALNGISWGGASVLFSST